jgi:hypothetical protein
VLEVRLHAVLDNAPCHNQTVTQVVGHGDMVILRSTPLLLCNPIEGCFSVLKACASAIIAMNQQELNSPRISTIMANYCQWKSAACAWLRYAPTKQSKPSHVDQLFYYRYFLFVNVGWD